MRGVGVGGQLLMLNPEMLKSQIPISGVGEWGRRVGGQLLMLSWEMLKSQKFHFWGGGGRGLGSPLSEGNFKISKSSPELKFSFLGGEVASQLLMLSPEMLKTQIAIYRGTGGTWNAWNSVLPPSMHLGWTTRFWHKILQHILSECITDSSLRKPNNAVSFSIWQTIEKSLPG